MKRLLYCAAVLGAAYFAVVSGLDCWVCDGARSEEECKATGKLETCDSKDKICSTEVRRNFGVRQIKKQCNQRLACENQRKQNWMKTAQSRYQCNVGNMMSLCHCCCETDSCNVDELCFVSKTTCSEPPTSITHGRVECSNGNKLGSVCRCQCTEPGYDVSPAKNRVSVCLGNGEWSRKRPCCARSCPPYLSMDQVALINYRSRESYLKRKASLPHYRTQFIPGPDAFQYSTYFYSGIVHEELTIDFGATNQTLSFAKTDDGLVNTGAALKYLLDNVFPKGHRHNHRDLLTMGVEGNSDDDVRAPAKVLRDLGVVIVYVFFESPGVQVDMQQARDIAGSDDKIVVVRESSDLGQMVNLIRDLLAVFCQDLCSED